MGVEPTTYTMRTYRSSQLSYYPVYFCDVFNIQLSRKNANQKSRKIEKIRISPGEWHPSRSEAGKNPEKEVVPEVGVEPTRCYQRQILSLVRLPFRHSGTEGI